MSRENNARHHGIPQNGVRNVTSTPLFTAQTTCLNFVPTSLGNESLGILKDSELGTTNVTLATETLRSSAATPVLTQGSTVGALQGRVCAFKTTSPTQGTAEIQRVATVNTTNVTLATETLRSSAATPVLTQGSTVGSLQGRVCAFKTTSPTQGTTEIPSFAAVNTTNVTLVDCGPRSSSAAPVSSQGTTVNSLESRVCAFEKTLPTQASRVIPQEATKYTTDAILAAYTPQSSLATSVSTQESTANPLTGSSTSESTASTSSDSVTALKTNFSSDATSSAAHVNAAVTTQHISNGYYPQMISSAEIYKMAPTPVYMTPSMYPQVALIPETDLLRSMIVQDVKQVTQKLVDKNAKKKRGRRSRKEEIIPGDFGTLTVNFTKFVDKEHPPFSLADPPAPKRTIYQRIAPYPVTISEPKDAQISLKPAKKTKGNAGRSIKRTDNLKFESSESCSKEEMVDIIGHNSDGKSRRTYKSTRLKRNASLSSRPNRTKDSRRISEKLMPSSSSPNEAHITDTINGLASETAFIRNFQTENNTDSNLHTLTVSSEVTCQDATNNINSLNGYEATFGNYDTTLNETEAACNGVIENSLATDSCSSTTKAKKSLDSNSNMINTSPMRYLSSNNGTTVTYSELLESPPLSYGANTGLGSPGVIGSELSCLLSELYSDFPPLSPANIDDHMETVTANTDTLCHNTTTVPLSLSGSVEANEATVESLPAGKLSPGLTASQSSKLSSEVIMPTASKTTAQSFLIPAEDQAMQPTASNVIGSQDSSVVYCTTEVISDSSWENNADYGKNCTSSVSRPLFTRNISDDLLSRGSITEDRSHTDGTIFTMDVDISQSQGTDGTHNLLEIVDISPEYASTEGGGKIILIGSWNNKTARYSCQFGSVSTPGDLIQNGVLRCFCPPHKPGKVKVAVLRNDVIISESVDFEYVDTEDIEEELHEELHDWLKIEEEDLKTLLLERIEAITDILDAGSNLPRFQSLVGNATELEDMLVRVCEAISKCQNHLPISIDYNSDKVMTVLHLAASLGYTKLIQTLCNWVETNTNPIIAQEADPCKQDQFQLTPLMWACAKGKFDTVCVLLQWDESAVSQLDACGCSPLSISRDQGYTTLVRYLEKSQSKGIAGTKNSSFTSENGSPNFPSGRLSRSSSLSSQVDHNRESLAGIDDSMGCDTWSTIRGPGSNRLSHDGSPEAASGSPSLSRTLGKTLFHVQAIIQDGVDARNNSARNAPLGSLDLDDDSLFVPSPFTPRAPSEDRLSSLTPKSLASLSPASPAHSNSAQSSFDQTLRDTAEFCEFFYNSDGILEKDFAELTLTDEEQQNLYKAASVIQNAYKRYRERQKKRDVELSAAVLIQSYYRRYKQYATFKRMQKGAVVIQHKYRAHREKEKQKSHAASVIQTYYRRYKERQNVPEGSATISKPSGRQSRLQEWNKSRLIKQSWPRELSKDKGADKH